MNYRFKNGGFLLIIWWGGVKSITADVILMLWSFLKSPPPQSQIEKNRYKLKRHRLFQSVMKMSTYTLRSWNLFWFLKRCGVWMLVTCSALILCVVPESGSYVLPAPALCFPFVTFLLISHYLCSLNIGYHQGSRNSWRAKAKSAVSRLEYHVPGRLQIGRPHVYFLSITVGKHWRHWRLNSSVGELCCGHRFLCLW